MDISICSQWIDELNQLLNVYDPKNIFNIDKTGVFINVFLIALWRSKMKNRGKLSKDRLTVLLACNIDGSQKFKPLIIGKSAKEHSFKGIKPLPT